MFKIWFNIRFGYGIHGLFYKKTESDLAMVLVILSSIQNFGPHLVGIGFYVSKSAKCVHTILQCMYVRMYVRRGHFVFILEKMKIAQTTR